MKNVSKSPLPPIAFQITGEFYEDLDTRIKKIVTEAISEQIAALRPSSEYLTRKQVCDRLHVTLPTTYRLCERGILTAHKLGCRVLFEAAQVEEAVNKL